MSLKMRLGRSWGRLGMRFEAVKLSEVADIIVGFAFKSQDFNTNGIGVRLVRGKNITRRSLRWGEDTRWWNDFSFNLDRYYLREKDIVIGMDGSLVGKNYAKINASDLPLLLVQRVACIRAKEEVSQDYLWQIIATPLFENYIDAVKTGTTIPHISGKQIGEYEIPYCNAETQERIASILSVTEEKIRLNTAINENLEQQIQAILLNMIQQDSEKDSIETVKLGEYLYIKGRIGWKGLKKDEYLDSSDYRIINGESLTKDGIDWNKAGFISKERYDESPEIMLQVGDILLSKDGTIGKIGYVDNLDSPSTVASGIFVIRNIKPDIISTQFIYYLLKSKLFSAFIASRTEGSVIPHLYQKDFMEFAFPLPNADEMSQFDALTSPLFATIIKNLRENEFLTATRDALLPKLMNGEIDVSAVRI